MTQHLIQQHLTMLSQAIGPRPAGSAGQRRAEAYLASQLTACGFAVEVQATDCPRWDLQALSLAVDGTPLAALANPFSPPCDVAAPVVRLHTLDELRQAELTGCIAVLAGELVTGPFNPRNFDVYRDETQDEIIALVEEKGPLALIMVSGSPALVPMMEDAAFAIPSVTVAPEGGAALLSGRVVKLWIDAIRQPSYATNLVARGPGVGAKRLVVCAHYDTKYYTPGALDNAAGVAALLALASRLHETNRTAGVELVLFGGEDSWYPAEVAYVTTNAAYFPTIAAAINIDGIGLRGSDDSVTFLACPEALVESVLARAAGHTGIRQVDPWYAGDHSLFWPQGIPSIALTAAGSFDLVNNTIHTEKDTLDQVDPDRIERTVAFLFDLVTHLSNAGI